LSRSNTFSIPEHVFEDEHEHEDEDEDEDENERSRRLAKRAT
jgi:hypothetical protein